MNCPDAEALASSASGVVDPGIVAHVTECPACARVLEALRSDGGEPIAPRESGGDPEPGDNVGRYVILARLGVGGMGVVSSAYDPVLDRTIALKSIRADRASPDLARRLEREAQSLAKLTHPHLVRVFDAGVDRGRLYLAMELVEGVTLGRWLEEARETVEIVRVFREIAEALTVVHAAGFVHRDVKPDNILIDPRGVARLADFGLVAPTATTEPEVTSAPASRSTDPFTAVGTPEYMSPEQWRGRSIDARSDQYSWGTSLAGALRDRPISTKLRRIVERATHEDPTKRWPDMAAIVDALAPRRAVWPFVAGGVAVAAAGIAIVIAMRPAADPCAVAPAPVWKTQAAAIAKAFEASGHSSWQARFEATARAAQAAEAALADASVTVCRWAHDAGRSDANERACLDEQRAVAAALFGELAHADRASVDQAPLAATRLERGRECLVVSDAAATPPAARPLASELHQLRARADLRPPGEVVEAVRALAGRATALGADQLEGETKLLLGELESRLRHDDVAAKILDEAARAAARARDDRVVALARLLQAGQAALLTANAERAKALGEVAVAAVERAGSPAELRGQLENILGGLAFSTGAFADAEKHYKQSIVARTEAFGAGDVRVAQAHQNVGIALNRLGRIDEARIANETAVAIIERAVGADHPDLATPLNSLGTIAADQKQFDEATEYFERAKALRVATFGPDHPDVAISENNLGKLAKLRGAPRQAIAHYAHSLAIVEAKLGPAVVEVALPLSGLAASHADLEEWAIARGFSERAIAVTEARRGADHPALISMLITYANILKHANEPVKRREVLERAYAIAKAKLGDDHAQTTQLTELLAGKAVEPKR